MVKANMVGRLNATRIAGKDQESFPGRYAVTVEKLGCGTARALSCPDQRASRIFRRGMGENEISIMFRCRLGRPPQEPAF